MLSKLVRPSARGLSTVPGMNTVAAGATRTSKAVMGATQQATIEEMYGENNRLKKRLVPIQLRESNDGEVGGLHGQGSRILIDNRVRKGPYWHLSQEAGAWCHTVYNRTYHPRAYVRPEDGGLMKEYEWLTNDVTMWNVAVERQIRVKGPDAEAFIDYVITRKANLCKPMKGKYVILCNQQGGILNDPVMLRPEEDEFWLSLSDSDIGFVLQGVNHDSRWNVEIDEIDVAPVQIQGPKSTEFMSKLVGKGIEDVEYYGLYRANINGAETIISRTGWSTERGYEIYLYNATRDAEKMWYKNLEVGKEFNLHVTAPGHHRRIEAGILSWGQDIDAEVNPYECGLGWQVDLKKEDFIGKKALQKIKAEGATHRLVGLAFGGRPITWYIHDYHHVREQSTNDLVGYLTSAWFSPTLDKNIAFAMVPIECSDLGNKLDVYLPDLYADPVTGNKVQAEVVNTPFKLPAKEELGAGFHIQGNKF